MEKNHKSIEKYLALDAVTVFSIPNCGYCEKTKLALAKANVSFQVVNCKNIVDFSKDIFRKELESIYGSWSFPRIFFGFTCIGGNSDLSKLIREGRLNSIIEENMSIK